MLRPRSPWEIFLEEGGKIQAALLIPSVPLASFSGLFVRFLMRELDELLQPCTCTPAFPHSVALSIFAVDELVFDSSLRCISFPS